MADKLSTRDKKHQLEEDVFKLLNDFQEEHDVSLSIKSIHPPDSFEYNTKSYGVRIDAKI